MAIFFNLEKLFSLTFWGELEIEVLQFLAERLREHPSTPETSCILLMEQSVGVS